MGVCATKLKETAGLVDPKAIQASVNNEKVVIGEKAMAMVDTWKNQARSTGQPVVISKGDVLPRVDYDQMKLSFTADSDNKDMLLTAIYVCSNAVYRNDLKDRTWVETQAKLKKKFTNAATFDKMSAVAKPASGAATDKALDTVVDQLKGKAKEGAALFTAEEEQKSQEYETQMAAEKNKSKQQQQAGNVNTATTAPSTPVMQAQNNEVQPQPVTV